MTPAAFLLDRPRPWLDDTGRLRDAFDFVWVSVQVPRVPGQLFRPSFSTRATLTPAPQAPFTAELENDDAAHLLPMIAYEPVPLAGSPLLDALEAVGVQLQRFALTLESQQPRLWRLEAFNFIGPALETVRQVAAADAGLPPALGPLCVVKPPTSPAPAFWCGERLAIAPAHRATVERAAGQHLSFTPVLQEDLVTGR